MKLYTIGFTKKTAEKFFNLLRDNNIKILLDIRLNNSSQLAGFTKGDDLRFFLSEICNADYKHDIDFAPTKEILDAYKSKTKSWNEYEEEFIQLLNQRNVSSKLNNSYKSLIDGMCLLCSEATPEQCHRRLVAEYIRNTMSDSHVEIVHL